MGERDGWKEEMARKKQAESRGELEKGKGVGWIEPIEWMNE